MLRTFLYIYLCTGSDAVRYTSTNANLSSGGDSSDDEIERNKKKRRRHNAHFTNKQSSNHSQREKHRSKITASVSSRSSKTKSSSLSSKPKTSGKKNDKQSFHSDENVYGQNIYDGTMDDTNNWTLFLKEKVVVLFRLKFIDVSTMCFIYLHFISTNWTQIVCKKSLKPRETLKEYKSFNNAIAITVLRAIVLHYKRYAEESYLELSEEEESYLDSLYNGSKSIKQIVSCLSKYLYLLLFCYY